MKEKSLQKAGISTAYFIRRDISFPWKPNLHPTEQVPGSQESVQLLLLTVTGSLRFHT